MKTRKVAYNPMTRTWQDVYPEDEGYHDAIELVWSEKLSRWVTVPQDDLDQAIDEMLADAEVEEQARREYFEGAGFGYHLPTGDDSGPDFQALR